ncbi:hypothetical protein F5H01DRAFT_353342 [Linnemannia elongata]|nr:hypothetical protein F5H01DRAFT_353342 [Linnemannia elongata]
MVFKSFFVYSNTTSLVLFFIKFIFFFFASLSSSLFVSLSFSSHNSWSYQRIFGGEHLLSTGFKTYHSRMYPPYLLSQLRLSESGPLFSTKQDVFPILGPGVANPVGLRRSWGLFAST